MKKNYMLKTRIVLAFTCLIMGFGAMAQVDVVATAGTPAASYPTLNAAFAAINAGTHQGNIGIGISANTTEAGPCVLNSSGAGAASYIAIAIAPTVDGVSISGPTATGRGLIELKGADNVTIDGDNPNTGGTNQNLSIINTAANTITYTSVVRIANATAVTSSDNITIRNCILTGSATGRNVAGTTSTTGSENTTFAIYAGGNGGTTATDAPAAITSVTTNTAPTGTTINSLLVSNNAINSCARAIVFNGNVASVSTGITISGNTIGAAGSPGTFPYVTPANTVYTQAIWVAGTNALSITGNTIQNILSYVGTTMTGINLNTAIGTGALTISNNMINTVSNNGSSGCNGITIASAGAGSTLTISGNTVSNVQNNTTTSISGIQITSSSATSTTISDNKVSGVWARSTGGYAARGILISAGSNTLIQNNMIWDINMCPNNSATTTTFGARGINITSGTGHKVYHNSISLAGPVITSTNTDITVCLGITATSITGMDVRNNIFSNTMTGGSATTPHACVQLPSGATSAMNLTMNNNAYYAGTTAGQSGILVTTSPTLYTAANFIASATAPATNSRSYTSTLSAAGTNDNASYASINPAPFVSATDLHLNTGSTELPNVEAKGDVSVPVAVDIDGNVRPDATTPAPDMGADEVVAPSCVAANGGTIAPATVSKCVGQTVTLSPTGVSTGLGISYQWKVATISGGPYSNVTGGTGATTTSYTSGALTAGTYYYVLEVTCSAGPMVGMSNEVTVTVNANPTVSVSPSSSTICQPGATPVALTASGASTYAWGPAAGLSGTTGTSVNATPAATTTYTVTGTDGNGCINTATAAITVNETPFITSVTATPSSVCSGANSQLAAVAGTTSYAVQSITHNAETPSGVATNIFTTGDDAASASITIPFPFVFFGTTYTNLFAYTNGFVQLGTSSASTNVYGATFPTAGAPNNIIAGIWDDLNVTGAGTPTVRHFTNGTAPNRVFIIEYTALKFYNTAANNGNASFQIKLYEGSNVVEVHVANAVDPVASNHYMGIENASGTAGYAPAGRAPFNTDITVSEGWSFTPVGVTYSWSPATFLSSTTIANPMANAITASTTYTLTVSNAGCNATSTVTINAGSALTGTSNITGPDTVCAGTTVTLNSVPAGGGAPYTYAWSGPAAFTSTSQNPTVVADATTAGTYTVVVTDNCSATTTSTVVLTVNSLPTLTVTPSSATYCNPGTAVALTASGTSTGYTWLPATGLSATTGANVNASPAGTTTYTVSGTDANGCVNTATALITSAPAVTVSSVTASPATVCVGSNSNLTATASLVSSAYCTAGATSTSFEKISNVTIGTINNTSSATAGYENFTAMSTSVTAGVATPISIAISSAYANDDRIHVWVDMDNDGVFASPSENLLNLAISTFCPACSGTNTVVNGNITIPVTAYNGPTRIRVRLQDNSSGANSTSCGTSTYGQVEDYVVNITGATDNTISYAWLPTTYLSDAAISNPVATSIAGNITYTLTATSSAGCSAQGNVSITTNPLPTVTATATATTVCAGTSVTLTGTGTATSYTWDNGVSDGVAFTPTATQSYIVTGIDGNGCQNIDMITVTVNPLPTVTATTTATAVCAGSSVTLTGAGTATSYTWDNGVMDGVAFTPTGTATYNVTGIDGNGCQDTDMITITVNSLPVVTLGTDVTQCGGTVVLDAGNAGSDYLWSDASTAQTLTVSASGTYSVAVTDPGSSCSGMDTINVTINALPVVTLGTDVTQCGGTVVLDAGNAGLNYMWSDATTAQTLTVSATGTYSVTVTNPVTMCAGMDTINVTINTVPVVMLGADVTQCGGTVMLDAGNAGATYLWSDATTSQTLTVTMSGMYYVAVDNGSCAANDTINVTINAVPAASMAPFTVPVCDNATAFTLTGGSPAGGVYSGTGVSAGMFDPTVSGAGMFVITYTVTDSNSCSNSDTATITVDLCSGIAANISSAIKVYPNPASGMLNIAISNAAFSQMSISIVDLQGKEVFNETDKNISNEYNKQINVEGLAKGVYYIKLNTGSESKIQKLIIQ